MKEYKLLSGEVIELSKLSEEGQKQVSEIERLIAQSVDYFEVYRQAFVPLKEGKYFDAKELQQLHQSLQYKVVSDLVARYHQKLFTIK